MEQVFVYGTLMRGLCNHQWLADGSFVREAYSAAPWLFVDFEAGYPAMMRPHALAGLAPHILRGELWRCDVATLCRLDILEGAPEEYLRVRLLLDGGEQAWAYIVEPYQLPQHGVPRPLEMDSYHDALRSSTR